MNTLSFHWLAGFKDGSLLSQFENGIENKFQLIRDRFQDLTFFILYNKDYSSVFKADLVEGTIKFGPMQIIKSEGQEIKNNIRLIYFRRNQIIFSLNGKENQHIINYHLGYQYQDAEGKNRKNIIIIDSKGNWVSGE